MLLAFVGGHCPAGAAQGNTTSTKSALIAAVGARLRLLRDSYVEPEIVVVPEDVHPEIVVVVPEDVDPETFIEPNEPDAEQAVEPVVSRVVDLEVILSGVISSLSVFLCSQIPWARI
jgi:nanoRNase/pAp phosphatase (c-di-AMP/oligoRNAs hydrolase)